MTNNNDNLHPESPERRELLRQGATLGALGLAGAGQQPPQDRHALGLLEVEADRALHHGVLAHEDHALGAQGLDCWW